MSIEESWLVDYVLESPGRSIAVDVGANRGQWSRLFVESGFERVVAIEPDHRASDHIDRSPGVEVVEAVASSEEQEASGSVLLYLRQSPDQNSLLELHPIGAGGCADAPPVSSVLVKCVSLASVCPSGADFVKIDVEGAESSVLSACSEDGRWDRCVFLVECHDTLAEVQGHLSRLRKKVTVVPHPSPSAHVGHCWAIGSPC